MRSKPGKCTFIATTPRLAEQTSPLTSRPSVPCNHATLKWKPWHFTSVIWHCWLGHLTR